MGRTRRIDVGLAGGRHFVLMAGFGFDAQVVGEVLRPVKALLGPAAYAFAAAGALAKYRSTHIRLRLDGEEVRSEAFLVVVANAASYAYRQIKLAPFAALDDGLLDVCVFERARGDRVGFASQMMAVLARRHLRDPRVRYYRGKHLVLESEPPIQGQMDGDTFGGTPIEISLSSPTSCPSSCPNASLWRLNTYVELIRPCGPGLDAAAGPAGPDGDPRPGASVRVPVPPRRCPRRRIAGRRLDWRAAACGAGSRSWPPR